MRDKLTGEITVDNAEHYRTCLAEYESAIEYLEDWQSGLFHIQKEEYDLLPKSVKTMLRIFQNYKRLAQ